jgi:hypothetical protein
MIDSSTFSNKDNPNMHEVYNQLCQSYRSIDDFRAKLLGFLPLASAGGIFLLLNDPEKIDLIKPFLGPIGLFGFVVTLGLFIYEIYGIEKCTALIKAGQDLECLMNIEGQFMRRPIGLLGSTRFLSRISEPFAAGIIYPAVLAVWLYLAFMYTWSLAALIISGLVFVLGFSFINKYTSLLPTFYELYRKNMKKKS